MSKRRQTKHTKTVPLVAVVAIIVIGLLEALALHRGIDGQLFALTIAAIAGIAGYNLKQQILKE